MNDVTLRLRYFNLLTLIIKLERIADRLPLNRVNSGTCIVLTFRIRVHERVRLEIRPKLVRCRHVGDLNETPARTINPATWKTMNGFTEYRALLIIRLL